MITATMERKSAIEKVKKLVNDRKESLSNKIPQVNEFEDGNIIIQYFKDWHNFLENTKRKIIFENEHKLVEIIFAKKGVVVEPQDFDCKKTYVVLNGRIKLDFEDKTREVVELNDFTGLDIPYGVIHGGRVLKDSYVLVIEEF